MHVKEIAVKICHEISRNYSSEMISILAGNPV